ncbi:MAG: Bax inhibitor-1 family protein, partial [Firmicutes bacterium]|nr:Bax inhibitor-1 family protein [Bacillota bacterium]
IKSSEPLIALYNTHTSETFELTDGLAHLKGTEEDRKESIIGALTLYLDFINLFLFLLRIFGRRR